VSGGVGALGMQVIFQAPQAKWLSPWKNEGFLTAWSKETIYGTAIVAGILTIVDPGHKWEGGLDEPRFHQHEHEVPMVFQNVYRPSYYGEDATGTWG